MPNNTSSITITDGIKIWVEPEFVQEENTKDGKKNLFSYRVEISNVGNKWAKLLNRYWCIINALSCFSNTRCCCRRSLIETWNFIKSNL